MRAHRYLTFAFALALAIALCGVAAPAVQAQQAEPDRIAMHYQFKVKPGMQAAFESALQQHMAWRKAQGDPWTWQVFQVAVGQQMGQYAIRSNNHTWADLDAYEAFGPKGREHFIANVMPYVESIHNSIDMADTEIMHMPDSPTPHAMYTVETYHLKPGKGDIFRATVKQIHDAIVEHDYPIQYAMLWSGYGTPGHSATFVTPHENWASMQGPEQKMGAFMQEVFGEEKAAELFQTFTDTFTSTESMIVRWRNDLSTQPALAVGSQ